MADYKLLPASWGKLNSHNAPSMSLLIVGACTAFLILLFSADAYDFAFSMCTVAIVITWAFARLSAKWGVQNKNGVLPPSVSPWPSVIGVLFNGLSFLLLTCVGYIPGFFIYVKARRTTATPSPWARRCAWASSPLSASCPGD